MISLIIIVLILFIIYSLLALGIIGKVNKVESGNRSRNYNALSASYVKSVLVIGTDGRSLDEQGRSDSMILVSLNRKTNTISLTSFMRDCYVEIPGNGWDKLNAAYAYGGADLLMDTIEYNFGVKIDDYVSVNFVSFAGLIDAVGGIDLNITDAEAEEINTIMRVEVNNIMGDDQFADMLSGGGNVHLNGKQALSYARIRYVGNADFERTERQRQVIELVMNKFKSFDPSVIKGVASNVVPNLTSNMSIGNMYLLSLRAPFVIGYDIQKIQIPADGTFYGDDSTPSGSVLQVDFDANRKIIEDTVFSS